MRKLITKEIIITIFTCVSLILPGVLRADNAASSQENTQTQIDEINQRIDEIETKTLVDKLNLGAELRIRADWYKFQDDAYITNAFALPRSVNEKVKGRPTTRFRVNMWTNILDNMSFNSRLTMYKNWNDSDTPDYNENISGRITSDASLRVERAYIDYYFDIWKIPVALTVGRLPFTDGMPTDLRDDTPRKSAYSSLAWDTVSDSVALSLGLEPLTRLPGSAVKFIFFKNVIDDDTKPYRKVSMATDTQPDFTFKTALYNGYIVQLETGLPGILDGTTCMLTWVKTPNIGVGVEDVAWAADAGASVYSIPNDYGDVDKYTFYTQSRKFLGLPVDIFGGYSWQKTKADGAVVFDISSLLPFPVPFYPYSVGLFNNDGTTDRKAHATHLGMRLDIPFEMLKNPKLGMEFFHSTRYWFNVSMASEDPLHKLDERGTAWEFYYIQPVNVHMKLRVGYEKVNRDYTPGFSTGTPLEDRAKISTKYFLIDYRF